MNQGLWMTLYPTWTPSYLWRLNRLGWLRRPSPTSHTTPIKCASPLLHGSRRIAELHVSPFGLLNVSVDPLLSPLRLLLSISGRSVIELRLSLLLPYLTCSNINPGSSGQLFHRGLTFPALLPLQCLHSIALASFMTPLLLRRLVRLWLGVHLLLSLRRKFSGCYSTSFAVVLLRVLAWCPHRLLNGLLVRRMKF